MVQLSEVNFLAYSGGIPANEANLTTALATAVGNLTPFARQPLTADAETQMGHFAPLKDNSEVHPYLFTGAGCAVNALDKCAKDLGHRVNDLQHHRVLNTTVKTATGHKSVFEILNGPIRERLAGRYDFGEITPEIFSDPMIQKNLAEDAPAFAATIGAILVGLKNAVVEQDRWQSMRFEQANDFGIQAIGNFHVPQDEAHMHAEHGGCAVDLGDMCKAMKNAPSAFQVWDGNTIQQIVSKGL